MEKISFNYKNYCVRGYKWASENPKAVVVFSHGMAEHTARYDGLGSYLSKQGLTCYAFDYIGHGYSKAPEEKVGVLKDTDNFIQTIVECMKAIHDTVKHDNKDLDMYLFAHSMGSMCAQRYIEEFPDDYKKVILSGTDIGGPLYAIAKVLAGYFVKKNGFNSYSPFINSLGVEAFDKPFKDEGTLAWLTRNPENVRIYKEDPLCGDAYPVGYYMSLGKELCDAKKDENVKLIKAEKVLLMSGAEDPVSKFTKSVFALEKLYKKHGINVEAKIIENARHETFNEADPVKTQVYETIRDFYLK